MTDGQKPIPDVRLRPRWMYQASYVLFAAGAGWLILSGRLGEHFRLMRAPGSTPESFERAFVTGLLWVVSVAPLALLSYDLGSQHKEARRFGTGFWRGLAETWRVAWFGRNAAEMQEDFSEAPDDDLTGAVILGVARGALPVALFLSFVPTLRTPLGIAWVSGAGLLIGAIACGHRRAAAYLIDEPGRWSAFRQWSLLNPSRSAPEGRRFARFQVALSVLLALWWLGVLGALVLPTLP